jgi:hypothetical protein
LQCIDDAQASNLQLIKDSSRADKTYQLEWRQYREFIDRERKNKRIPEGQFYLTRENFDVYFGEIVNKLTVHQRSAFFFILTKFYLKSIEFLVFSVLEF